MIDDLSLQLNNWLIEHRVFIRRYLDEIAVAELLSKIEKEKEKEENG